MKTLLLSTAALLLASASAHADLIPIDDFNTNQGSISDTTADGAAVTDGPMTINVGGNAIERTISIDLLDFLEPPEAEVQIAGGIYDINLGPGDDAEARLIYGIDALSDDFAAMGDLSALALLVQIVAADGTFTTLQAVLNGTNLGTFDLPDQIEVGSPQTLAFALDPTLDIGGTLELIINGAPGYDLAFNLLGFETTEVPAPPALALFGLGLMGLAAARKRTA